MAQSLYELLTACTVRVTTRGSQGTGFFVAPGLVLTCKHVVENALKPPSAIEVAWQGQSFTASLAALPTTNNADIALLQVTVPQHPCALLYGDAKPFGELYSFGYSDNKPQGVSVTFYSEGWVGTSHEVLRLKDGQVRPGMSGSPILNNETGCVCGIMQSTRDRAFALGGEATMPQVILREFPDLTEKQKQYHSQDRRWYDAMSPAQRKESDIAHLLPQENTGTSIEVFYSYAKEDENKALRLQKHLILLKRQNLISDWYAGKIAPGEKPADQIKEHLDTAKIILLLISSDYLFSDYHDSVEVKRAMERSRAGDAIVIPILLSPIADLNETPFGKLLILPRNRKPVDLWPNKDEAFAEIAKEIRAVVNKLRPS